jgi:beta-N-acetylhexosaminidase
MSNAVVYGCAGPELSADERAFFRDADPFGFILFARNCIEPKQIRRLCADMRAIVGRDNAPILIDQEGGRVQRLRPPHWRTRPAARFFGDLYAHDPAGARDAAYLCARLMAHELSDLGITVDCAPVLDVPVEGAHDIIGDRAFARDPLTIIELGRAVIDGLLDGGVLPVIKHMPGHGRAAADSHFALPRVDASVEALSSTDFVTFRSLNGAPCAMTAHVVYEAIDPQRPATTSALVIRHVIRGEIGFDGLLFSDDLSMQALDGTLGSRAKAALFAGCDVVIHCNGKMDEMKDVAANVRPLAGVHQHRAEAALSHLAQPAKVDVAAAEARLTAMMEHAA